MHTLQLEELAVGECSAFSDWELIGAIIPPVGIPSLPVGWAALRRLRRLALRGHNILRTLPDWLARSALVVAAETCCGPLQRMPVLEALVVDREAGCPPSKWSPQPLLKFAIAAADVNEVVCVVFDEPQKRQAWQRTKLLR